MDTYQSRRSLYTFERFFSTILFGLWTIVLLTATIYRVITNTDQSNFFYYYTNWSWFFQTVFYTVDMVGRIIECVSVRSGRFFRMTNVYLWFWLINGSVWIVIVIVTIIVQENPNLLITTANDMGGIENLGFVTSGHILFHYVPGYMVILYMILERDIIGDSVVDYFKGSNGSYEQRMLDMWLCFCILFSVIVPFGIYSIIFDPETVYGFSISVTTIVFIALITLVFTNVLPFIIFVENYVLSKQREAFNRYRDSLKPSQYVK